jgi:hypothetical protein
MPLQVAEMVVLHAKDHHKFDLNAFSYSIKNMNSLPSLQQSKNDATSNLLWSYVRLSPPL